MIITRRAIEKVSAENQLYCVFTVILIIRRVQNHPRCVTHIPGLGQVGAKLLEVSQVKRGQRMQVGVGDIDTIFSSAFCRFTRFCI